MKKLLCIVLVFMILSLVSCDNQHSDKEKIEEKIFDKYSPIEVLETYQDYARAMDIVSANRNSVKTRFVLRDNIGEEYKGIVENIEYSSSVLITTLIPEENADDFILKLTDMSAGTIFSMESGRRFMAAPIIPAK